MLFAGKTAQSTAEAAQGKKGGGGKLKGLILVAERTKFNFRLHLQLVGFMLYVNYTMSYGLGLYEVIHSIMCIALGPIYLQFPLIIST